MTISKLHVLGLLTAPLAQAAFNAYPSPKFEAAAVAQQLGVSRHCFAYLNQTVDCPASSAPRAAHFGIQDQYWSTTELDNLCTPECLTSLKDWYLSVESSCTSELIHLDGNRVEPKSLPQKYTTGYNSVCMKDNSNNYCAVESHKWEQSSNPSSLLEECFSAEPPSDCANFQPSSVQSMYTPEVYCSDCFIQLWKDKMASPAAQGKYLEYLQQQYESISTDCLVKPDAEKNSKSRRGDSHIAPRGRGTGTFLKLPPQIPVLDNTIKPCSKYYVVDQGDTCPSISQKFGVSISDLKSWNKGINKYCTTLWKGYAICLTPGNEEKTSDYDESIDNYETNKPSKREEATIHGQPEHIGTKAGTAFEAPCTCHEGEDKDSCYARCQEVLDVSAAKKKKNKKEKETASAPQPPSGLIPSTNGKCGGRVVCTGTKFGECCSTSGYCGSGAQYCALDTCASGNCDKSEGQVTLNGQCGPNFPGDKTCVGSAFGKCCSKTGYCGSNADFCSAATCHSGECEKDDKGNTDNRDGKDNKENNDEETVNTEDADDDVDPDAAWWRN